MGCFTNNRPPDHILVTVVQTFINPQRTGTVSDSHVRRKSQGNRQNLVASAHARRGDVAAKGCRRSGRAIGRGGRHSANRMECSGVCCSLAQVVVTWGKLGLDRLSGTAHGKKAHCPCGGGARREGARAGGFGSGCLSFVRPFRPAHLG
jgi:hypothetical protein